MRRRKTESIFALVILLVMLSSCVNLSGIRPPTGLVSESSDTTDYTDTTDITDFTDPTDTTGDTDSTDGTDPAESAEPTTPSEPPATTAPSEVTETPATTVITETTIASGQGSIGLENFSGSQMSYSFPPAQNILDIFSKYDVHAFGPAESKVIYLSFNAGYEYNNGMSRTLDILAQYGVKATFFVDGAFIRTQNALTKRIANEGHQVGNHTLGHTDLAALAAQGNYTAIEAEIKGFEELYRSVVGTSPHMIYRPPASDWSERSFEIVRRLGYRSYMYSYAYRDWEVNNQLDPATVLANLKEEIYPGSLIMLHTVSETNALVLEDFIKYVFSSGFVFGVLPVA